MIFALAATDTEPEVTLTARYTTGETVRLGATYDEFDNLLRYLSLKRPGLVSIAVVPRDVMPVQPAGG
jgi:hypothetical protein